jgi:hypothetical protein
MSRATQKPDLRLVGPSLTFGRTLPATQGKYMLLLAEFDYKCGYASLTLNVFLTNGPNHFFGVVTLH